MKTRNLKYSLLDGSLYSLMVGLGESYLPAFVLAAGFNDIVAGQISVIPYVLGSLFQLFLVGWLPRFGSNRRLVVTLSTLQALSLFVLAYLAFRFTFPVWVLMLLVAAYWTMGLAAGPLWNVWINSLVPVPKRMAFFNRRTQVSQFCVFLGLVAAGAILHWGALPQEILFGLLFLISGFLRLGSSVFLWLQQEGSGRSVASSFSLTECLTWLFRGRVFFILLFLFLFHMSVQISGPYFNPFMLKVLGLSYAEYTTLVATSLAARVLGYQLFPKWAGRLGLPRFLVLSALGIASVPALWITTTDFSFLMVFQALSGLCWGGFELTLFLYLLDSQGDFDRSRILSWAGFLNATGMLLGSWLGAKILGTSFDKESYTNLYAVSSWMRLSALIFLPAFLGRKIQPRQLFTRWIGVRHNSGAISKPVLNESEESKDRIA